jgi:ABC-2 type transport system ATP-binding protein
MVLPYLLQLRHSDIEETEARDKATAIIDVQNLWKVYSDGTEAVRDVSFSVEEGEFFAFLGPNGAGKSTTIKVLITLLRPTRGRAIVLGHDVTEEPVAVRRLIGYAAQEIGVDDDLTARENLVVQGRLYHIPATELRRRIDELLELVDLAADADRPAGSFSGGMRKRLDLATGLIHKPGVLFLDEPTTGLDPQNRAGLWEYLEKLNKEEGLTVFLTTHYLEEADHLADRIAIIDHGEIIAAGTPNKLKADVGGDVIRLFLPDAAARERAAQLLRQSAAISNVVEESDWLALSVGHAGWTLGAILDQLRAANLHPADISLTTPTLDDVFIKYTGERIRQESAESNWRNKRGAFTGMLRR